MKKTIPASPRPKRTKTRQAKEVAAGPAEASAGAACEVEGVVVDGTVDPEADGNPLPLDLDGEPDEEALAAGIPIALGIGGDGEVLAGVVLPAVAEPHAATAAKRARRPAARATTQLVRDPLSRYLSTINKIERLTPEEEHELAVRYRELGDHAAAAQLVTANLRLVVAVAMGFRRAINNILDLIQEGNLGLMEAVDRYDPHKGTRLSTYATWWIWSRIVKYLLDNWRLVRVGTTNSRRKLLYNLRREKERFEARGIVPTPRMLADRLGTTPEDVIAVDKALGASDVSLDMPVGEDGKSTRGDHVAATGMRDPETEAADNEFTARLNAVLAAFGRGLPRREATLLRERLLAEDPITLQQIADREGVTREAVRQSEKRLVDRLKAYLLEHFPEAAGIHFDAGA